MAGHAPKRILIVIVNYRSAGLAIDCLRSLAPEVAAYQSATVALVENASGDDSMSRLSRAIEAEGWGSWVKLVEAPHNGGFAAGNNVALAPALQSENPPDLIWLLNPDTIVRPGALQAMVDFLAARPDVGLVGSQLIERDGTPQQSAFHFPTMLGEFEGGMKLGLVTRLLSRYVVVPPVPSEACQIDWVAGASLMVRREVFDAVGLLDDSYFMYFEEVDFCLKALRAGWPCWYLPESKVVHLVGQSSGVTNLDSVRKRRPKYWFDSRRRYFLTNHGRLHLLGADIAFAVAFAIYRLRSAIQRKPDIDPKFLLWDFCRYNFLPMKFSR